jgi:ABC-type transport system involved in Fe-S cluster assembly fused permease/ATPase subunit
MISYIVERGRHAALLAMGGRNADVAQTTGSQGARW